MTEGARLNLIVIRSADLDRARAFYEALGCVFESHRHGKGPVHLSCDMDGLVFEVYPAKEGEPTDRTRLGFLVRSIETAIAETQPTVVSPGADSEWGRRAVIEDPDGRRVELTERG